MQTLSQMIILTAMIALLAITVEQSISANLQSQNTKMAAAVTNKIFG